MSKRDETVIFFKDMARTLNRLSDEEAGVLMKALFAYANGESTECLERSDRADILFTVFSDQMDRMEEYRNKQASKRTKQEQNETNDNKVEQNETNDNKAEQTTSPSPSPYPNPNPYPVDDSQAEDWPGRPTVKNVQEWAAREGVEIDAIKFVTYYERKNWMTGDTPIKDWRAVARAWAKTERQVKVPDKPPDQPKKPGKYESWLATVDYSDLVAGRAKK